MKKIISLSIIFLITFSLFAIATPAVGVSDEFTDFEGGFGGWVPFTEEHPTAFVQLSTAYSHSSSHSLEQYSNSSGVESDSSVAGIRLPVTSILDQYELALWVYVTERSDANAASLFGFAYEDEFVSWNPWGSGSSYVYVRQSEGYQVKGDWYNPVPCGLTLNTWHQVKVIVYTNLGTVSIWLDGSLIVEQWPAFNAGETPNYYDIECSANYYGTYVMHQYIDDVEVVEGSQVSLPWKDDFERTELAPWFQVDGWGPDFQGTGSVAVEDGELSVIADSYWYNVYGVCIFETADADFELSVIAKIMTDSAPRTNIGIGIGEIAGEVDENKIKQSSHIEFGYNGYYKEWIISGPPEGSAIERISGASVVLGDWTKFAIKKLGDFYEFYVDDELVLSRSGPSFSHINYVYLCNGVGVHGEGGTHGHYDDVLVCPLDRSTLPWRDDFDYDILDEMKAAGWTLSREEKISVGGGVVTLDNDGAQGSAIHYTKGFASGVCDFKVETRSRWVGRSYGHNGNFYVYTQRHHYSFWGDGFYHEYAFQRDDDWWFFGDYTPIMNAWTTFTLEKKGNTFYMYQDGELKYTYVESDDAPDEIVRVDISCGWVSTMEYDYISVEALYQPPVHNLDTGLDYATIQEAIDAPETLSGHTILVDAGIYFEHVVVDKSLSLIGEHRETTIVDGSGTGSTMTITADNVTLTGFKVQNSSVSLEMHGGIFITSSSRSNISYNIITNNNHGIRGYIVTNSTIHGNSIVNNSYHGVDLETSNCNTISGNTLDNNVVGVKLEMNSHYNTVSGNTMTRNSEEGIELDTGSSYNTVSENNIANNHIAGIQIWGSSYNNISQNVIANNSYYVSGYGIWFDHGPTYNNISENLIANHSVGVKFSYGGSYNRFYHNNFSNNTDQALPDPGDFNIWDDGYPSGGNYWDSFDGTDLFSGPFQNETSCDGIGDTSYIINESNQDNYPLMYPWGSPAPPSYTLTVHSEPTGMTFTVDGVPCTTSWSGTYNEDTSVGLIMPENHTVGEAKYYWSQWSDTVTNRSRTVVMSSNVTLTACYTGPFFDQVVYSTPVTGITFTINGTPQTTPYAELLLQGSYTLEMPPTHIEYVWSHWLEDGDLNRTKTIIPDGTTWTAVYAIHDIAVVNVVTSQTEVFEGDIVDISVTVKNEGTATATFNATTFYGNNTIQTQTDVTLNPGVETTLAFSWNTSGAPGNHAISAEACIVLGENDISDNTFINGIVEVIARIDEPIKGENATIEGNVTITNVLAKKNTLHIDASGPSGSIGWINVTFPMVNTTEIKVFINNEKLTPPPFPIITANETHYFIYFEFTLSAHEIDIQYAVADLAVTNVTPSKTVVGQGCPLNISITVQNQGHSEETFNVTAYFNETAMILSDGKNYTSITLPSDDSATVTLTWNTTDVANGNYAIGAYSIPIPFETDIDDNMYTDGMVLMAITGDINGDGFVDICDLALAGQAYGSYVGEPGYSYEADVNVDGHVDMRDIIVICRNFGKVAT